MKKVLVLLCLLPLLGSCGQSGRADFSEIRYHLTGGVAGFDRSLIISDKGTYQVDEPGVKPRSGLLPNQRLRLLNDKVRQIDWANLDAHYTDERIADALSEGLTIRTPSGVYNVIIGTGGRAPTVLEELVGLLRQLTIESPG